MLELKEINNEDLMTIEGGSLASKAFKVAGGVLTIVGSVAGGVASGGAGVVPAVMGVVAGIGMIGDGLND